MRIGEVDQQFLENERLSKIESQIKNAKSRQLDKISEADPYSELETARKIAQRNSKFE